MLQKLNERIQGVVAWVVIILVAITFTLFGVESYIQARQSSTAVVEVNGQQITKQAFQLNYQRSRQARDPSKMTAAAEKQLKQQLLDDLILSQVSLDSARSHGFNVSVAQANQSILQIPQFQEDGQFSSDRYQQVLTAAMFTPELFQKEVQQGMLLSQQRFAFMGTAFALPSELRQFVRLSAQTRDYRFISISPDIFLDKIFVSEEEKQAYYTAHTQAFLSAEQVSLSYVRLSMADIKSKIHLSEHALRQYYEDNKSNYLTDKSAIKPYSEVKADIAVQLMAERAQADYARALEELSDLSYQSPDSLTPVAEKLHLSIEETPLFSREGSDLPLTKNKQIIQAAFSRDVLALGNNSAPIQLDNESVLVLRVQKHILSKAKPLNEVAPLIAKIIAKEKATAAANQLGQAILQAKDATRRETLMQENQLTWQSVDNAARETEETPALAAINTLAFSLPRAPGAISGESLASSGAYVVVELQKVRDGRLHALDKEHLDSISKQIEATDGEMDYDFYISQLLQHAKIVRS